MGKRLWDLAKSRIEIGTILGASQGHPEGGLKLEAELDPGQPSISGSNVRGKPGDPEGDPLGSDVYF